MSYHTTSGEYAYIVPVTTTSRAQAASLFTVEITHIEDECAADLSRGDGKEYFRYLRAHYTFGGIAAITRVWLSRTKDTTEGDGRTEDINKNPERPAEVYVAIITRAASECKDGRVYERVLHDHRYAKALA